MHIKGAIFDLDGTILDSMPIWSNLGNIYLKAKGKVAQPDLAYQLEKMSISEAAQYFIDNYAIDNNIEKIENEINEILFNYYHKICPIKNGVKNYLAKLKQNSIPMVIATSSSKLLVKIALKRLDIYQYFSKIFTTTELNTNKTESKIYTECAKYLAFPPNQIIVHEDVLFAINTAKNAGFNIIAVYDESSKNDELKIRKIADKYIYSFNELLEKE